MYQFFRTGALPSRGEQQLPEFRRIRMGLQANAGRVLQYFQDNPRAVANGHPLVRLLMSLNVPITLPPEIYVDKVRDVALYTAKALGFTTALHPGRVLSPSAFYGENVTEVLWAHMDEFDVEEGSRQWRELTPVRLLYHPKTDLSFQIPNGRYPGPEGGWAVIALNVPMLALQYRMWREEQRRTHPTETQRSLLQFVMELPLPRMLPSHVDWVLFNRLMALFFELHLPALPPRHPYYLTDWSVEVDQVLVKTLRFWQGRAMNFDQLISAFPAAFAADFHDVLQLPDLAFVRPVQWAVVMARLMPVTFLVQYSVASRNRSNESYLNYLRRYLTAMDLGGYLRGTLPPQLYTETQAVVEEGIRPYL